jgi:molecular chaperone DnaJ
LGGPPGDLYVSISVREHEFFTRRGEDLLYVLPVSFAQLVLGDNVEVPGIDKEATLSIPPGTQSGQVFRLKGMGIKRLDGRGRGNQLVKVQVKTPKNLTANQKELLKEFEASFGEKKASGAGNLADKVKKMFK